LTRHVCYGARMTSRLMLRAAVLLTPLLALAGCSGASTGSLDPNAPQQYGDKAQQAVIDNPKLIVAIVIAVAGASFVAWLWRSPVTKIVLAMVVAGAAVYFATRGH